MSEFSDGEQIIRGRVIRSGEDIAKGKNIVQHTKTEDLKNGCPCSERADIPWACLTCDFTDQVGYCCHPINVQKEIGEGRARPLIHDYDWPERKAHYDAIFNRIAYKKVDER
jgi:hypothetical protein